MRRKREKARLNFYEPGEESVRLTESRSSPRLPRFMLRVTARSAFAFACKVAVGVPLAIGIVFGTRAVKPYLMSVFLNKPDPGHPTVFAATPVAAQDDLIALLRKKLAENPLLRAAQVYQAKAGIEITLPGDLVFPMGSARIAPELEASLRPFVHWLYEKTQDQTWIQASIAIESHTDDDPIIKHHNLFRSNWELSAARAASMAMLFEQSSFPEAKLTATGFAASRPVATNKSLNRRIVIRLNLPAQTEERGG